MASSFGRYAVYTGTDKGNRLDLFYETTIIGEFRRRVGSRQADEFLDMNEIHVNRIRALLGDARLDEILPCQIFAEPNCGLTSGEEM